MIIRLSLREYLQNRDAHGRNLLHLTSSDGNWYLGEARGEHPLSGVEWRELLGYGTVGRNFKARSLGNPPGTPDVDSWRKPYGLLSQGFVNLYKNGAPHRTGQHLKELLAKGSYYTFNPLQDSKTYQLEESDFARPEPIAAIRTWKRAEDTTAHEENKAKQASAESAAAAAGEQGIGTAIPNRDLRIIANIVFGERQNPVYDNVDPMVSQMNQNLWPLKEMQNLGLIDQNGMVRAVDSQVPIARDDAIDDLSVDAEILINELIRNAKKYVNKKERDILFKHFPEKDRLQRAKAFAAKITDLIPQIQEKIASLQETNGIMDGVIDDITGLSAPYPTIAIDQTQLINILKSYRPYIDQHGAGAGGGSASTAAAASDQRDWLPFGQGGSASAIGSLARKGESVDAPINLDEAIAKIEQLNPEDGMLDISIATISRIEQYLTMHLTLEEGEIEPSDLMKMIIQVAQVSDYDERAMEADAIKAFAAEMEHLIRTVIRQYIEVSVQELCMFEENLSTSQEVAATMDMGGIATVIPTLTKMQQDQFLNDAATSKLFYGADLCNKVYKILNQLKRSEMDVDDQSSQPSQSDINVMVRRDDKSPGEGGR